MSIHTTIMKEKEEEIQLYQITNIDKTKGQSAGHLDHWLTNDTLRTLLLNHRLSLSVL